MVQIQVLIIILINFGFWISESAFIPSKKLKNKMIILGTPRQEDVDKYFMADGDLAFKLHQAGFIPKYQDEDCLYFKLNNKLVKYLSRIGEKI